LIEEVYNALSSLPWSGDIRGFDSPEPIYKLATYATCHWLSTVHEDQMLDLLRRQLCLTPSAHRVEIQNMGFQKFIQEGYTHRNSGEYEESRYFRVACGVGQALASCQRDVLGFLVNLNASHWVAVVMNFREGEILYGDSLGEPIPGDLAAMLDWWTNGHTGLTFVHKLLPITRQHDGFSCGLLSFNALAHYVLPEEYLLIDSSAVDDEQLNVMMRVIKQHSQQV
ncbi:hypothetical protein BV22DRAFT_994373, partial [Leucogyrophana mollusca]